MNSSFGSTQLFECPCGFAKEIIIIDGQEENLKSTLSEIAWHMHSCKKYIEHAEQEGMSPVSDPDSLAEVLVVYYQGLASVDFS